MFAAAFFSGGSTNERAEPVARANERAWHVGCGAAFGAKHARGSSVTFGKNMKAAFSVIKNRPKISVCLTRDSVCAGDDCDAPHEKETETYSFTDPAAFAQSLASIYLPSVAGVGHSWICRLNGIKIAEITTSEVRALIRETTFSEINEVHFTYISAAY